MQDDICARCGSDALVPLSGVANMVRCRSCGTVTEVDDEDDLALPRAPKVRKLRDSDD